MSPEPLRAADYEDVENMDQREFRTRLLYDLDGMFTYMKWWMWVMGGLNAFLLTVLIGLLTVLVQALPAFS